MEWKYKMPEAQSLLKSWSVYIDCKQVKIGFYCGSFLPMQPSATLTCAWYVSELPAVALLLPVPAPLFPAEVLPHFDAIFPPLSCIYAQLPLTISLCVSETLNNTQCLPASWLHSPADRKQSNQVKTYFLLQCSWDTGAATDNREQHRGAALSACSDPQPPQQGLLNFLVGLFFKTRLICSVKMRGFAFFPWN